MSERLPKIIDPMYLADKRGALKGQIPINNLSRIAEMLYDDKGEVFVELFFEREGKLAKIEGQIQAQLELKCQNCLQALEWPVNCRVKLGVVNSIEHANNLPEDYEPLLMEEEQIPLINIVEDELLLNLPIFPKHSHSCLAATLGNPETIPLVKDSTQSPENPFSVLANLKILENYNGSTKK